MESLIEKWCEKWIDEWLLLYPDYLRDLGGWIATIGSDPRGGSIQERIRSEIWSERGSDPRSDPELSQGYGELIKEPNIYKRHGDSLNDAW